MENKFPSLEYTYEFLNCWPNGPMVFNNQKIIWQFNTVISSGGKSGWNKCPTASGRFEGVSGCVVEAGIGEDGQGAHSGEDDEDPEEHAVHHHGHVLPVLLQLDEDGWMKGSTN